MNKKYYLSTLLVAFSACMSSAYAQPDPNAAGKADNPANLNMGGGGRGGRGGNGGRGNFQQLTPEQLRQFRTQQSEMRALNIRQQLTFAGYTEEALQTTVVNYYKANSEAQTSLLEQWQKISQAVQAKNTPDTQMATMLNDFRAAVDKEKDRREVAYATLSKTLDLPAKPMLDAFLMTQGLAGDESSVVGQGGGMTGGMNIMNMLGGMMGGMGGGGANFNMNMGGGQGMGGGMGGPGGGGQGGQDGPPPPPPGGGNMF